MRKRIAHASLFSGIGGFDFAAEEMGWENIFHCEWNSFGKRVLKYWFPKAKSYDDITKTDFTKYRGLVDVLTGGFPCQPFSVAGSRGGADDDRYLWPEMLRAIDEIRPTWVIGENVTGITTMVLPSKSVTVEGQADLFGENYQEIETLEQEFVLERICKDLEGIGYTVQPLVIPACAVGAPHRRDRIWIIAQIAENAQRDGRLQREPEQEGCEIRQQRNAGTGGGIGVCVQEGITTHGANTGPKGVWEGWENQIYTAGTIAYTRLFGQEERQKQTMGPYKLRKQQPFANPNHNGLYASENRQGDTARDGGGETWENAAEQSKGCRGKAVAANATCERSKRMQPREQQQTCKQEQKQPRGDNSENIITNANNQRCGQRHAATITEKQGFCGFYSYGTKRSNWENFPTQSPICRGDDGISDLLDADALLEGKKPRGKFNAYSKWRTETLKAYGNAIVPEVALRIFQAIDTVTKEFNL